MSGYTAMPTATYALVHDAVAAHYAGREWPEELVALHLRWLVGEFKRGELGPGRRQLWPTTRELGAGIGWRSVDRVARFVGREADHEVLVGGVARTIRAPHWMDPHQIVSLDDLRGDRLVGVNRHKSAAGRTGDGRETDGARTARTEQRQQSASATDGGRTGDGRETDAVRVSLRAGTTVPGTDQGVPAGATQEPLPDAAPPPADPDPAAPVRLPDGRMLPGDIPGLLPRLSQRDLLRLARAPGIDGAAAVLRIPAGRLRFAGGIGEALAGTIERELRRQGIEPGCLAEELPKDRGPPARASPRPAASADHLRQLFPPKAAK